MIDWVEVRHRLPKEHVRILAYWPKRIIHDCQYDSHIDITFYDKDDGWYYPGHNGKSDPTHWAYIHEPNIDSSIPYI